METLLKSHIGFQFTKKEDDDDLKEKVQLTYRGDFIGWRANSFLMRKKSKQNLIRFRHDRMIKFHKLII